MMRVSHTCGHYKNNRSQRPQSWLNRATEMKSIGVCCALVLLLSVSDGFKILGIFPTSAPSHFITGSALMKGLAANGHEVTVISPFPQAKPLKNYRDVTIDGMAELMKGTF